MHQPSLKNVFKSRSGQFVQPANDSPHTDLSQYKQDGQHHTMPKSCLIVSRCIVHDIPQEQSIQHTACAVERLHQHQGEDIQLFLFGDGIEPFYRIIFHIVFSAISGSVLL